jgi:putative CocE/NonD family hydrolase
MSTRPIYTHSIQEWTHFFIPLADGIQLAARAWLPTNPTGQPIPAILEYIPYRKRDGTAIRDEQMHPYWAAFGYACVRVDMRGCGESDGLMLDEYLQQELDDAVEIIAWLADQDWCTGKVGMMGKSWGGFNALQVAALAPDALKAVITVCSTDDRYADDIHYRGGALLTENFSWASTMTCTMAKAPDPLLLPDTWREKWLERLQHMPFLARNWLEHSYKDDYWKHGSINEDYCAIKAAVYCIGGWGDAYSVAIPRMMQGLQGPKKALIGPWAHKYPNFASPKPEMDFLAEAKRWWDYWLKDINNGVMSEPTIAAYIQDSVPPQAAYDQRPGLWVEGDQWPLQNQKMDFNLSSDGRLTDAQTMGEALVQSPLTTGAASGEYCVMWCGPDFPTDQRQDDANSLCFDSEPLTTPISLLGAGELRVKVTSDKNCGQMIIRLCDIAPNGSSKRISYGVLNLAMREGFDNPQTVVAGEVISLCIKLDDTGYQIPTGHRLRLAISSAYFPLIWPAPQEVKLTLDLASACLTLPIHDRSTTLNRDLGQGYVCPVGKTKEIRPEKHSRITQTDAADERVTTLIDDDFGEFTFVDHNLTVAQSCTEKHTILPHDPHSAYSECRWHSRQSRPGWDIDVYTYLEVTCDADYFYLESSLEALENGTQVHQQHWQEKVSRGFA